MLQEIINKHCRRHFAASIGVAKIFDRESVRLSGEEWEVFAEVKPSGFALALRWIGGGCRPVIRYAAEREDYAEMVERALLEAIDLVCPPMDAARIYDLDRREVAA